MSVAPPKLCRVGHLYRGPRCPTCTATQDRARGSAHDRGYGAEWASYSQRWLARFPWCGQRRDGRRHAQHSACTQRGELVRADVVDHIRSIRDGGARLDPANHQSLCTSCNVRKG